MASTASVLLAPSSSLYIESAPGWALCKPNTTMSMWVSFSLVHFMQANNWDLNSWSWWRLVTVSTHDICSRCSAKLSWPVDSGLLQAFKPLDFFYPIWNIARIWRLMVLSPDSALTTQRRARSKQCPSAWMWARCKGPGARPRRGEGTRRGEWRMALVVCHVVRQ